MTLKILLRVKIILDEIREYYSIIQIPIDGVMLCADMFVLKNKFSTLYSWRDDTEHNINRVENPTTQSHAFMIRVKYGRRGETG